MVEHKTTRIKLFCPSVGKIVPLEALEEEKLDLGAIARAFGLDPSTLKLNRHFISRGAEHISSSVTWKSLLSFFSAKRLPTGENDSRPLVVDGKLCKVGTKRVGFEDGNLVIKSKKMRTSKPESSGIIGTCSKRKQLLEDVNLLKKLKISEANPDIQGRSNSQSNSISSTQLRCSYISGSMKRMREDEAVVAAPYKKIR